VDAQLELPSLPFSLPSLLHCRVQSPQLEVRQPSPTLSSSSLTPGLLHQATYASLPLPLLSLRIRPLKYSQSVRGIAVSSQCSLKLSPSGNRISCYILTLKSDIWLDWWHQFINFPENQLTTLYAIQATQLAVHWPKKWLDNIQPSKY